MTSRFNWWERYIGLYRDERTEAPAYVPEGVAPYFYWDGSGQSYLTQRDFLKIADPGKQSRCLYSAPGFLDYLGPRADVNGTDILLRNLSNIGRLFELVPVGVEGQSDSYIQSLFNKAVPTFSNVIPEDEKNTWFVQFFLEDEASLEGVYRHLEKYIAPHLLDSRYTQNWLEHLRAHLQQAGQANGLFFDQQVSGGIWRARMRRVRLCLWHNGQGEDGNTLAEVSEKLKNAFAQANIKLIARTPADLHDWLRRWFAPGAANEIKNAGTAQQTARVGFGLLDDDGGDLVARACQGVYPGSDAHGNWYFRKQATRFVCFDSLADEPPIGLLTAEQKVGTQRRVLWDNMPPASTLSLTIQFCAQAEIAEHIRQLIENSGGGTSEAEAKRTMARRAQDYIAAGHKLYRVYGGVFVRGDDLQQLKSNVLQATSILDAHGLRMVAPQYDLIAQDCFLRALPFSYNSRHDGRPYIRRSRLWFGEHIQRTAPIWGRSTGTGNPGLLFWNRGAEPLSFDILNPEDRKRNAHLLMLGPTGSGKTATLIYMLLQMIAVHRPRLFIITSLPAFGLLAQYLQSLDISVNYVRIGEADVSLPPFADAHQLLGEHHRDHLAIDDDDAPMRDRLAEMESIARLMITGGDMREEADLRRADMNMIRRAIINAAETADQQNRRTKTSDVVQAMRTLASNHDPADTTLLNSAAANKLIGYANAMDLFCQGMTGDVFNREGSLWPEADITIIELGAFAKKDYQAQLSVAILSLLNKINEVAERSQYESRQLLTIIDEAHILLKNPLVVPTLNNIMAMWRTFGAWLWLATQTLAQFPENAREMLNQPEWLLALSMDRGEVEQIARFKHLSEDQKALLLAARKASGDYVEGVVISDVLLTLFRSVVPPLSLALAQTEKSEKAARAEIMKQHQCSELQAVYRIAERIKRTRAKGGTQ
ncbi:MAG: conjugative transfer ATPase [Chromatiales bacterium]|nr:conjugative transfer ATPase [Chromatiales bacterium]